MRRGRLQARMVPFAMYRVQEPAQGPVVLRRLLGQDEEAAGVGRGVRENRENREAQEEF